jgi:hypothetical protein
LIFDYTAEAVGGQLSAGDDASDAAWVTRAELDSLDLVARLADTLAEWDVLPRD